MILLDSVHKKFGAVHAVKGVSFELVPGQIAGLLGPNGAGKTTTIRMIVGYSMPDGGRVLIDGCDTADASAQARARVGYMPESTPLYPEMRVNDYLDYRGRLFGLPRPRRRAAIASVTDWCSLESVSTRRIGALSKGFRQRVGLAAALLHDPPVLVLDEPTNGLDPTQIHEVRGLVKRLSERRTMLISSHILSEVERLCDRIIIMSAGVVRADGTPSQLGALMSDGRVYQIEAKAVGAEKLKTLTSMLAAVAGVDSVEEHAAADDGWYSFVVRAKAGATDLREALAGASQRAGAPIRELHAVMPTLERVFRTLTENDTPSKAEPKMAMKDGEA